MKNTNEVYMAIIDHESEQLIKRLDDNTIAVEKRARKDGSKAIPRYDTTSASDVELELKSEAEKCGEQVNARLEPIIAKKEQAYGAVLERKRTFEEDPKGYVIEISKKNNDRLGLKISAIDEEILAKMAIYQDKLQHTEKEYQNERVEKNRTEDKLDSRPRHRGKTIEIVYYGGITIVIVADMFYLVRGIEQVGDVPFAFGLVIAFALAMALATAGHYLGSSIKIHDRKGIIGSSVGAAVILLFISFLRLEGESHLFMALVNLGIFIVFSVMAYFYEYDNAKLVKKYFADEKQIEETGQKVASLKHTIATVKKEGEDAKLAVYQEFDGVIAAQIKTFKTELYTEYELLSVQRHELIQYRISLMKRIDAIYRKQIHQYRTLNQDERRNKDLPLVEKWENSNDVEPLRLPINIYSSAQNISGGTNNNATSPTNEPEIIEVMEIVEPELSSNGIHNNIIKSLLILILATVGLTSCNNDITITNAVVLIDETEPQDFHAEKTADFILQQLNLDTHEVYKNGVIVQVSTLSDIYTNTVNDVMLLPRGNPFSDVTVDRINHQADFRNDLIQVLDTTYQYSEERLISKLYQPICETLNKLVNQSEGKKICIIYSDMLENTEFVSFYQYRKQPQQLLTDSTKETLFARLKDQCVLESLTGVELYVIHQPDLRNDELYNSAKKFWRELLEPYGCQIEFVASV